MLWHTSHWKPLNYGIIWSNLLKWTSCRCLPKQITFISFFFSGPPVPLSWQPISWLHALLFPVPRISGVWTDNRAIWGDLQASSEKSNKENQIIAECILITLRIRRSRTLNLRFLFGHFCTYQFVLNCIPRWLRGFYKPRVVYLWKSINYIHRTVCYYWTKLWKTL